MIKRILLPILLLATHALVFSQAPKSKFGFANYLIDKEFYEDATFELNKLLQSNQDLNVRDSSNFLLGRIYFSQKKLSDAVYHFDLVGDQFEELRAPAVFFSALSGAYLSDYSSASLKLRSYKNSMANINQLKILELASINVLKRDFYQYDSLKQLLDKDNYMVGPVAENLDFNRNKLLSIKGKTGLKAGLLSALIPGAGRIYVEKPGQGIYQLIIATLLGLQTWEGYKKDGIHSARFIIYGTLFTSFYIGNIWGSAIGVKMYKNEINKTVDNAILMDMHIPLRTIFR